MEFINLIIKNILNCSLACFLLGIAINFKKFNYSFSVKVNKRLTVSILLLIGLKGGVSVVENFNSSLFTFILSALILWGLLQPLLSFYLLRRSTTLDSMTAAAVAASFGSISVMTFIAATSFLDQLQVPYQEGLISILAIMEIPAIISGILIAHLFREKAPFQRLNFKKSLTEALFNRAIFSLVLGMVLGMISSQINSSFVRGTIAITFKPLLSLFLFDMGLHVGRHRHNFKLFSWPLGLFGFYMPLIGGSFGFLLSYMFNVDPGTGTLITALTASASYIAVPAAMRIALPQAKEAIYLPLSLGVTFPFNLLIGIPFYYQVSTHYLK